MKPTISLQRVQEVVRAGVCANCRRRSREDAPLPPDRPRACEGGCALFGSLPKLRKLAVHLDPVIADFGRAATAAAGSVVATREGRKVVAALRELTGRSVRRS